ncbi:MAG TPA: hypothetical protein VL860_06400 [Planctomycetota bacterium]|nr:hypothetical protein [Planctomycetota bacterium]
MSSDAKPSGNPADAPAPKKGMPMWAILLIVAAICLIAIPCVGIIAAIALPGFVASKAAANETACRANLKSLATAQAQYMQRTNSYAASGKQLVDQGNLISTELANAFENFQGNGDSPAPMPKTGSLYRMLLGEGSNPKSYVTATNPTGDMLLSSWGATGRPAQPPTTGVNQFYITEAGTIYKQPDPMTGKFLLDAAPPQGNNPGWSMDR